MNDDRDIELAELLEEVRRIDVLSKRLVTDVMAGRYSSVFRGSGIEFDRVREYVEGDAQRAVDWNVTARMGRPFVKTYTDERELTVLFLLDLSASMAGGFSLWSARQTAARICACLALSATRNNDKVGLIGFSDGVDKYVPAKKGVGHALRIVRDCLALPGGSGRTNLAPALEFTSRVVRRHAILFLVSDFLTDGWQHALGLCARRHDVIAVRLLAPELDPPNAGLLRTRDPESGRETVVDWSSPRVRAAYAQRIAAWRQETEDDLRRAKVDLMDVPISRELDKDMIVRPILKFFRMRELRGTKR
ncbi:MAG: DUF58 domain-containing protein [Planctomycetota bacterium]|nr:DUF58 domain-containing protein [Planctomycetota bacterium]